MLQLREEVKWLSRKLPSFERMCLNYATVGNCDDLKADLVDAIIDRALFGHAGDVRTREQFLERAQLGWRRMSTSAHELIDLIDPILIQSEHAAGLRERINARGATEGG